MSTTVVTPPERATSSAPVLVVEPFIRTVAPLPVELSPDGELISEGAS